MALTRRSYPFPTYEGDDDFIGTRKTEVYPAGTRCTVDESEGPWTRLHSGRTLSSIRRHPAHVDREAPRDSLDFSLKAKYNNHREFLKDRNEVVVQRETLGGPHTRKLKNREEKVKVVEPELGHPLRIASCDRRENNNSIKSTISGHHTQTTNVGYSRKPDGGFYTS